MKSYNEITATWAFFTGCPRLSRKTADHPTCNSRKSVQVVLPGVAETLNLMHTHEGTTTKEKTMTNKQGKNTVWKLLDMPSYVIENYTDINKIDIL